MDDALYILENRPMPWGDYGDILLSGLTAFPDRDPQGRLLIERVGPFVPPLVQMPLGEIVITETLRQAVETSGLSGIRLCPAIKERIVDLPWHTWDWGADDAAEYPESGEPEDYILTRPHDQAIASQMEPLWEVCLLEEHARTERTPHGPRRGDDTSGWSVPVGTGLTGSRPAGLDTSMCLRKQGSGSSILLGSGSYLSRLASADHMALCSMTPKITNL